MAEALFANDANSTLAAPINNVVTTATLASGSGALFPNPGANQYFIGSFIDAATGTLTEIVHVTARSADTLTIVRGQEGTAAQAWNTGDIFAQLCTAGTQALFAQPDDLQMQKTNYGVDTGTANALVVAAPITQPTTLANATGMVLRVKKIGSANSGATTLTYGTLPSAPVILPGGAALSGGELAANGIASFVCDGTSWELQNSAGSGGGSVPSTRQVNTTNGLTGGGDLSANRTLQPVYGTTSGTVMQGNDARVVAAGLLPVQGYVHFTWNGSAVTVVASAHVSSVTRNSQGNYAVTLDGSITPIAGSALVNTSFVQGEPTDTCVAMLPDAIMAALGTYVFQFIDASDLSHADPSRAMITFY